MFYHFFLSLKIHKCDQCKTYILFKRSNHVGPIDEHTPKINSICRRLLDAVDTLLKGDENITPKSIQIKLMSQANQDSMPTLKQVILEYFSLHIYLFGYLS